MELSVLANLYGQNSLDETLKILTGMGIHTVELKSGVDKLTFTHEAFSRQGFAEGAVVAAELTEGLKGVHTFKELILK